jgi:type VI secretion system Hcp family effector
MELTFAYEKSAPKLLEKLLRGEVIPKVEIELTATYGGARATYLKYELKNVQVTSYNVTGENLAEQRDEELSEQVPTVVVRSNFEEIKVTYTEYDDQGSSKGKVETTYKVEKGAR